MARRSAIAPPSTLGVCRDLKGQPPSERKGELGSDPGGQLGDHPGGSGVSLDPVGKGGAHHLEMRAQIGAQLRPPEGIGPELHEDQKLIGVGAQGADLVRNCSV